MYKISLYKLLHYFLSQYYIFFLLDIYLKLFLFLIHLYLSLVHQKHFLIILLLVIYINYLINHHHNLFGLDDNNNFDNKYCLKNNHIQVYLNVVILIPLMLFFFQILKYFLFHMIKMCILYHLYVLLI